MNKLDPEKIITVGLLSILWVLAVTSLFVYLVMRSLGNEVFVGWVNLLFMCATPFQIMMAIVWHNNVPQRLSTLSQPKKGFVLTAMFFMAGIIVMPILYFTVGQGILSPILIHFVIQSVVVTLFVFIAFECWPITQFSKNPIVLGLGTLIYCYILNFALFMLFYDYSFFENLPFYAQSLDPKGLFNGITALTFAVTCAAILMLTSMFDMWPTSLFFDSTKQPIFGIVACGQILIIASLVYYVFIVGLAMDPMDFMVKGPVSIIFGTFLVQNMMQFQLLSAMQQPLKGTVKMCICFVSAWLMYQLYQFSLPLLVGENLATGPEQGYAQEIWIATAMLGITFPVINFVSGAFEFWPVKPQKKT